jgi:hypothetical protein
LPLLGISALVEEPASFSRLRTLAPEILNEPALQDGQSSKAVPAAQAFRLVSQALSLKGAYNASALFHPSAAEDLQLPHDVRRPA